MATGSIVANFPGEFVQHLTLSEDSLWCGLSNGSVHQIDPTTKQCRQASKFDSNITGLCSVNNAVLSSYQNGQIHSIDSRTSKSMNLVKSTRPISSMAVKNHELAFGTELTQSDAGVLLYDLRKLNKPLAEYMDAHNDDVTDIKFHFEFDHTLLSGSTDGTVNLYNTSVTDADDAIYQTINHNSSIHQTEFTSTKRVMALSHMETMSIYQVADPNDDVKEPPPTEFGDLRQAWDCEYVACYLQNFFLVGSNNRASLKLVQFANEAAGSFIELKGAHGEDVARSAVFADQTTLYTGGEDGLVKEWTIDSAQAQAQASTKSRRGPHKEKKHGSKRSTAPY